MVLENPQKVGNFKKFARGFGGPVEEDAVQLIPLVGEESHCHPSRVKVLPNQLALVVAESVELICTKQRRHKWVRGRS